MRCTKNMMEMTIVKNSIKYEKKNLSHVLIVLKVILKKIVMENMKTKLSKQFMINFMIFISTIVKK